MKLNKNKIYDFSELTSEEENELLNYLKRNFNNWNKTEKFYDYHSIKYSDSDNLWYQGEYIGEKTNAKELFYTLENIQVDCRELSKGQIKEICRIFTLNGFNKIDSEVTSMHYVLRRRWNDKNFNFGILGDHKDGKFYTITYDKFMELFGKTELEEIKEFLETNEEAKNIVEKLETSLSSHYDNTSGSIYKFCNDQKLNAWEFDIIKRVVRCRKKGQFKEDLQKTKDLIDLYLKEFEDEK